jgi:hypothetical protein
MKRKSVYVLRVKFRFLRCQNASGPSSKFWQYQLLKPDLALALTWWSVAFPNSKQKVVGNTTMNLQKFDDGWKIVASHSSTAEM